VVTDPGGGAGTPRRAGPVEPVAELRDGCAGRAEHDTAAPVSLEELAEPGRPRVAALEPPIRERHQWTEPFEVIQRELTHVAQIIEESPHHELIGHGAYDAAKGGAIQGPAGRSGLCGMPQHVPISAQGGAERRGTRCQRREQ
jgi:hypothetical protein